MKKEILFPTIVYSGTINLSSIISDYSKWIEVEKLITDPLEYTTTHNGYQRVFSNTDKEPNWYSYIFSNLLSLQQTISSQTRASWVISYKTGGYQDPHIHASSYYTVVVNIKGQGDLLLYDPRPMAVALSEPYAKNYMLNPGEWIAFPGWLSHSSRPCNNDRDILVIDLVSDRQLNKQTL